MSNKDEISEKIKKHYDHYPLDFLTKEDEKNIEKIQGPFKQFTERYISKNHKIANIGCGPGRAEMFLTKYGYDITGVDVSEATLKLAKKRAPKANYIIGDNSNLPFPDQSFDVVISDGVIHHTVDPKRSFLENMRILKKEGFLYLGIYRKFSYYHIIYRYIGKPIRLIEKSFIGKYIINLTLIPLYYLVHFIKSGGTRKFQGAKNFFYDYIITPKASFISKKEILTWSGKVNLKLVDYISKYGNTQIFIFEKF